MNKIRKGDEVVVITGRDKGRRGTVIKVLAFPLYILTLGLIGLLINAFLLWFTAWITSFWSWGLRVEDFWLGLVAAIIISLINWIFGIILRPRKKD